MSNNYNKPAEVLEDNISGGVLKANLNIYKMIMLGILAGAFIAIGAQASSVAAHTITNLGLARVISGAIFPVGLMMIVLVGGELFTGNCMIAMAVFDKKTTWYKFLRNLFVVYFANMIGAGFIALLVFYSGQYNLSDGALGAYTIKVAMNKVSIDFVPAIISGALCNVLVCIAILKGGSAKDIAGKCIAIFFPIWTFVVSGFEHCVANMFFIPAGLLASTKSMYVDKACELYGYTADSINETLTIKNMFIGNMLPVTFGNVIGGMIMVGLVVYSIHKGRFLNRQNDAFSDSSDS